MTEHILYGQRPERHLHPFIGLVIDLDRRAVALARTDADLHALRIEYRDLYGLFRLSVASAVHSRAALHKRIHEAQAMICTLTVRDEAQRGTIAELRAALSLSDKLVAELVAQKAELGETHARLVERAIQLERQIAASRRPSPKRRAGVVAAVPAARPGNSIHRCSIGCPGHKVKP
jgi:hypothetical protein